MLLVDMREALGNGLTIRPIDTMMNHATTELYFDNLRVPGANLIGREGQGFNCILDGMNAERILIAAECIGDARWFTANVHLRQRAGGLGRPIGANQGCSFPIARAHIQTEAAALMVRQAADLYDAGQARRGRGQYGQIAGIGSVLPRRGLHPDPRRAWLRRRVRRGAQVPRDPPVPGGAHLHQPDPVFVATREPGLPKSF